MNRWLLVWNLVLTVLVVALVLVGCSSNNAQITYLANQVEADKAAIAQLQATVAQHTQLIQAQQAATTALSSTVQTSLQTLSAQLQQYVQQVVQQATGK